VAGLYSWTMKVGEEELGVVGLSHYGRYYLSSTQWGHEPLEESCGVIGVDF